MFNLGMGEMLIIAVIALVFIGPRQLPDVARTIARMVNEWKKVTSDLSQSLMEARDVTESAVKDTMDDIQKSIEDEDDHHHDEGHEEESGEHNGSFDGATLENHQASEYGDSSDGPSEEKSAPGSVPFESKKDKSDE